MARAGGSPAKGRLFFGVSQDLASQRLIRACQALQLSGLEEPEVAKFLVNRAKAIRAFIEAAEFELARESLETMVTGHVSDLVVDMVKRRVDAVLAALPAAKGA